MQLLHSAATTRCTLCYQTPFRVYLGGWVTRLNDTHAVVACGRGMLCACTFYTKGGWQYNHVLNKKNLLNSEVCLTTSVYGTILRSHFS